MLSFKEFIEVRLDKKHIGNIKEGERGFQYFPKGQKDGGDVFSTIEKCKGSLYTPEEIV